jgi:glycosyltransferase involved in cell wall biosynthesis
LSLRRRTRLRIVVWTMHNVEFLPERVEEQTRWFQSLKRAVYRVLYRLLASQVDGIVAVSDQVRQSVMRQMGPIQDKVFTICNAVGLKSFEGPGDSAALCRELGLEPGSHLVATIGRLTEQKGHRYLIDAAAAVVSSHPDTHLLFIGDGELKDALLRQAQRSGLSRHIHFLGVRQDVPDLLAAVDLFVLPSLWEGLSVALLEAMASGKPVVATAVSGTDQAVIPGQTGLVVPPGNSQALADAVLQLLSHPAQAQAMGQAARQHVETNFNPQKQANEHLALYDRLLQQRVAGSLR